MAIIGLYDHDAERWITSKAQYIKDWGSESSFTPHTLHYEYNKAFYHGTRIANAKRILQVGLHGGTLSDDPFFAQNYGEVVLEILLPPNWKLSWGQGDDEVLSPRRIPAKYIKLWDGIDRGGEFLE